MLHANGANRTRSSARFRRALLLLIAACLYTVIHWNYFLDGNAGASKQCCRGELAAPSGDAVASTSLHGMGVPLGARSTVWEKIVRAPLPFLPRRFSERAERYMGAFNLTRLLYHPNVSSSIVLARRTADHSNMPLAINLGFARSGTTSFFELLQSERAYRCKHYSLHGLVGAVQDALGCVLAGNLLNGRPVLQGVYPPINCLSQIDAVRCPQSLFALALPATTYLPLLDLQYPQARFVLMHRDAQSWMNSLINWESEKKERQAWLYNRYVRVPSKLEDGAPLGPPGLAGAATREEFYGGALEANGRARLAAWYSKMNEQVMQYFAGREAGKFMAFNITEYSEASLARKTEMAYALCEHLGVEKRRLLPRQNVSPDKTKLAK